METIVKTLIYIHAAFGGVGLLAGTVNILIKKGGRRHRAIGKWFTVGMLTSSLLSLVIARMPGHVNDFLFCIGVFTTYMILSGNRVLRFRPGGRSQPAKWDWALSGFMFAVSFWMVLQGAVNIVLLGKEGVLFIFFGAIGLALSLGDIRNFRHFRQVPNLWLKAHIRRIVGAYIASVTAFIVAGLHWNGIFFWVAPALAGSFYISYWTRKVSAKRRQA